MSSPIFSVSTSEHSETLQVPSRTAHAEPFQRANALESSLIRSVSDAPGARAEVLAIPSSLRCSFTPLETYAWRTSRPACDPVFVTVTSTSTSLSDRVALASAHSKVVYDLP